MAPWPVAVEIDRARPLNRFRAAQAIGGALDGHEAGETAQIYTQANLRAMGEAGLGAVSYRLRTELGVEAWHLDQAGQWSEPGRQQGYWTSTGRPAGSPPERSSAAPGPSAAAPGVSWGYGLPRRGNTTDQANDNGWSRLDDGAVGTFWKSDPYLDRRFTGEPEVAHPQWALVDLGAGRPAVDAVKIAWGAPWATRFRVQRYVGGPDAVALAPGRWVDFPDGVFRGRPGTQTVRVARQPLRVRFVRVLLQESSHTAPAGSRDIRDRLGYAIRELYVGRLAPGGRFVDLVRHAASHGGQTPMWVSSTDSWHRASDLDRGYEQPSFQTVMGSGLARGRSVLLGVPVLYGTPQNAVAELRYARALGMKIAGVELGEEPDGQLISPEDYGALWVQFARAIERAFPRLRLGGPGYATSLPDWEYWPDAHGQRSWTRRWLAYLGRRGALGKVGFFSFEWYPFDNVCARSDRQLARARTLLSGVLRRQREEGLRRGVPIWVTEYGWSAYAARAEVDMAGALLNADTVGTLLSEGAKAAYVYGWEPGVPMRESSRCDTWGNLMLLRAGEHAGDPPRPVAAFWETQMLARDWAQAGEGWHTLYATRTSARDVHAYAVRRPDGRMALLVLNLSPTRAYRLAPPYGLGRGPAGPPHRLGPLHRLGPGRGGPLDVWRLSHANYRWQADGAQGRPSFDRGPEYERVRNPRAGIALAPYSVTVIRSARG